MLLSFRPSGFDWIMPRIRHSVGNNTSETAVVTAANNSFAGGSQHGADIDGSNVAYGENNLEVLRDLLSSHVLERVQHFHTGADASEMRPVLGKPPKRKKLRKNTPRVSSTSEAVMSEDLKDFIEVISQQKFSVEYKAVTD